jgi:hypothetical protein
MIDRVFRAPDAVITGDLPMNDFAACMGFIAPTVSALITAAFDSSAHEEAVHRDVAGSCMPPRP